MGLEISTATTCRRRQRKPWMLMIGMGLGATILLWAEQCTPVGAADEVEFLRDGTRTRVSGEVVVQAQDGGLLLRGRDGRLWMIQPDEIENRRRDDHPFEPLGSKEIARQLLSEMPDGFKIHKTAHYLICYNTSQPFAVWVGSLYERLYRGFYNYWRKQGIKLTDPDVPLVVLVFRSQAGYARYARKELGNDPGTMIGYYHLGTNRVSMYDLTGVESLRPRRAPRSSAQINQVLAQPAAADLVATIVHEATHQLAFNSGLQERFADLPLWVCEGLAIYFETPDLKNKKGWGAIGRINRVRLNRFRQYLASRPNDSLTTLLATDKRFRDPRQSADAYAEAWALNYYLLRSRKKDFIPYLKALATKKALVEDGAEKRIAEFKAFFGEDLEKFDREFLRFVKRLR